MYSTKVIDIEDMAQLAVEDQEAFALNRRKGFGASDSSVLLEVNKWTTLDQLIAQKNAESITLEELEVGSKPAVRMGADLEPIVLDKFAVWSNKEVHKPTAQYRLEDYPMLTVNYDGVFIEDDVEIPVECKVVSMFARKFWNFDRACDTIDDIIIPHNFTGLSIKKLVEAYADSYGIPPYYYTQIQQQLIGTKAEYAWLVALDVKNWEIKCFKIFENEDVQRAIIMKAVDVAAQCDKIPTVL